MFWLGRASLALICVSPKLKKPQPRSMRVDDKKNQITAIAIVVGSSRTSRCS